MRNIRLLLEYDGTDFAGWQRQEEHRSVQEVIETALSQMTQQSVTLIGAGRTDAGVHARGQVANFLTDSRFDAPHFQRSLNAMLPADVVVRNADEVNVEFSARYDARERWYRYFMHQVPDAINRRFCWPLFYELDVARMNEACEAVLRTESFGSFCKSDSGTEHFRCIVTEASWERTDDSTLYFSVRANRFLRGMVRALVGTMVDVGRGFTTLDEFRSIIAAQDRTRAGMSAPPQGLFLEGVRYD
ncbi:MAG: tRNA pseudouridine(38-40) synthase TruA [Ignavibacteriales bacterium]|nr:tRNA pseudouridine(38-40) synthase TruA [Ignavibacteriales bacterium]